MVPGARMDAGPAWMVGERMIGDLRMAMIDQVERNVRAPRRCSESGCGRATRARKPFCTRHIERQPYVQHLLETLAERDRQDELVRRRGARAVRVDSLTAQEVLVYLRENGSHTAERIARELNLDPKVASSYLVALQRAGLITTRKNRRGRLVATLAVNPLPGSEGAAA